MSGIERDEMTDDRNEVADVAAAMAAVHFRHVRRIMQAAVDPAFPAGWGEAEYAIVDFGGGETPAWCFREVAYPAPHVALERTHGSHSVVEVNAADRSWRVLTTAGIVESGRFPVPVGYV